MKISLKLVCQYKDIFFNFSPTSSPLYPLQVENCDSNSILVEDEDENGMFRLERVRCKTDQHEHESEHAGGDKMTRNFLLSDAKRAQTRNKLNQFKNVRVDTYS